MNFCPPAMKPGFRQPLLPLRAAGSDLDVVCELWPNQHKEIQDPRSTLQPVLNNLQEHLQRHRDCTARKQIPQSHEIRGQQQW